MNFIGGNNPGGGLFGAQGAGGIFGGLFGGIQNILGMVMGLLMGLLTGGLLGRLMGGEGNGMFSPGQSPGFGGGGGGIGSPAFGMNNAANNFLGSGGGGGGATQGAAAANPNATIPSFGPNPNKQQVGQMLDAAASKYGIPPNILKAVAYQESGWRADAKSFDGQHGKGIMQIDDRFHQFARTNEVWDPVKNIDYGANLLKSLYDKTGSWEAALKRYNGGSSYPPKIMAHAQNQPWKQWGV